MTLAQTYHYGHGDFMSNANRFHDTSTSAAVNTACNSNFSYMRNYGDPNDLSRNWREDNSNGNGYPKPEGRGGNFPLLIGKTLGGHIINPMLMIKFPSKCPSMYGNFSSHDYNAPSTYDNRLTVATTTLSDATAHNSISSKRDRSMFEEDDDDGLFMSKDEIERFSPSRKDGIDAMHETHLRYSYCAFLQNLGLQLELPQTIIGTAMVLCHRFFVRRLHACNDRFALSTLSFILIINK